MFADYDLCVIGGGINGAGIARDAAGRGLSVLLVEAHDLAGATSSASTKLIHGGLRYLEQYDFNLVRSSLKEREVLLRSAPHIIWPMEFILPHSTKLRPAWMIRLGLFLYDHLGGRKFLKKSSYVTLKSSLYGAPLKDGIHKAFSYSDCWVEDSRLVVLNAMDAKDKGADILTRTAATQITPDADKNLWTVQMCNMLTGDEFQITSKMVVNAAGPWVRGILEASHLTESPEPPPNIKLVKGSHIILPKLYDGDHAYILQQDDKRIVFAIPYEKNFTLIGTTDSDFTGDPSSVHIDEQEKTYLCNAINQNFKKQITTEDIASSYSGVRPLIDDGESKLSEVTRDYKLHLETHFGPPILSVFGGKLTTFRKLSEQAVDMLVPFWRRQPGPWTETAYLPGGDIADVDFDAFVQMQTRHYHFLPADLVYRYARAYGTAMGRMLKDCYTIEDLGRHFGDGLYEAEAVYLLQNEFAMTAEDIVWRRSKLGYHIKPETLEALEDALPDLFGGVKQNEFARPAGH